VNNTDQYKLQVKKLDIWKKFKILTLWERV